MVRPMCYEHVLTQDPERLLEAEMDDEEPRAEPETETEAEDGEPTPAPEVPA